MISWIFSRQWSVSIVSKVRCTSVNLFRTTTLKNEAKTMQHKYPNRQFAVEMEVIPSSASHLTRHHHEWDDTKIH
ncbi:hypothetical protein DMENIID0001_099520 [Sergentomyia squamirostris]